MPRRSACWWTRSRPGSTRTRTRWSGRSASARLAHFIGLRTWRDAGVRVAINTDHMFGADRDSAMNPFNPFLTMATAVTRRTESGQVLGAGEAVTREEALRMMTIDAAALTFDEGSRGSIEVGKLADLAILSEDLLTCPDDRIRAITADVTIVGGVVAHERGKGSMRHAECRNAAKCCDVESGQTAAIGKLPCAVFRQRLPRLA